ncbi:MAG TPA: NlpC/P60 family protein [Syntrophales bacterium]|nr:NlpC/P60 family protein [Syntrophales bacterium]
MVKFQHSRPVTNLLRSLYEERVKGEEVLIRMRYFLHVTIAFFLIVFLVAGCAKRRAYYHPTVPAEKQIAHMGYTIQVGAFSNVENAARLTDLLRERGLEAIYYVARAGLYKVRIGNFSSKVTARERAESLKSSGIIDEYYVVSPNEYAIAKQKTHGDMYIREELVKTAQSFVDVPYLWGGSSSDAGFDCSGLAMTVYQYNGLNLPRSSREQYEAGAPVDHNSLLKGDLVFFGTTDKDKISHVGIYIGDGRFIHAPGGGKRVRMDSMSKSYYKKRYLGGRTYL